MEARKTPTNDHNNKMVQIDRKWIWNNIQLLPIGKQNRHNCPVNAERERKITNPKKIKPWNVFSCWFFVVVFFLAQKCSGIITHLPKPLNECYMKFSRICLCDIYTRIYGDLCDAKNIEVCSHWLCSNRWESSLTVSSARKKKKRTEKPGMANELLWLLSVCPIVRAFIASPWIVIIIRVITVNFLGNIDKQQIFAAKNMGETRYYDTHGYAQPSFTLFQICRLNSVFTLTTAVYFSVHCFFFYYGFYSPCRMRNPDRQ